MDLLVSENESSSSEALSNSRQLSGQRGRDEQTKTSSGFPTKIRQEEYQSALSTDDEDEEEQEKSGSPSEANDRVADIKNEMLKSKITTSASVILTRLPPNSSKVIKEVTKETNFKITIRCQPIGSAPQLNPTVFKISDTQPFATLIKFINKKLKKKLPNKEDVIYCYVNNSFAPSPDEIIGNLYKHFATNSELVVSYCNVVAFG